MTQVARLTPEEGPYRALFQSSEKAPPMAVPLVKLVWQDRMPIRLDAKESEFGPAVLLDMDLQGSSTRASTGGR
ncbi:MAG: hypothetical protein IPM88_21035 [Nitrospira sp.]|nr:hypothetical protein [Nitrospira sp.]